MEDYRDFDRVMKDAQDAHRDGVSDTEAYQYALDLWQDAEYNAPNTIERGRAVRGYAASASRLEMGGVALDAAREAMDIHGRDYSAVYEYIHVWGYYSSNSEVISREAAESEAVYARMLLLENIDDELQEGKRKAKHRRVGKNVVAHYKSAHRKIKFAERLQGYRDQHKINLMGRYATATALYGNRIAAMWRSIKAIGTGSRSEAPSNPSSANMSESDVWLKRRQAMLRGLASMVLSVVPPKPDKLRQTALKQARRAV